MSTPVATIADALIAFILSLLRDPAAAAEFDAAPQAMLANKGLEGACTDDVKAVKPVIVDHPQVMPKPVPPPPPPDTPDEVVKEITRIVNQFTMTVDNRSTIVDQSVNQNIWTEGGDVTQLFDQDAVVASGDGSVAAGDDATIVDSEVDVTVGDIAIGNTDVEDSFNDTTDADAATEPAGDDAVATESDSDADAAAAAGDAVTTAVDAATDAAAQTTADALEAAPAAVAPPVEQPADLLASDMTATGDATYESDAATVVEEPPLEEPIEEP